MKKNIYNIVILIKIFDKLIKKNTVEYYIMNVVKNQTLYEKGCNICKSKHKRTGL